MTVTSRRIMSGVILDSLAALEPGDIVWKVNAVNIGPPFRAEKLIVMRYTVGFVIHQIRVGVTCFIGGPHEANDLFPTKCEKWHYPGFAHDFGIVATHSTVELVITSDNKKARQFVAHMQGPIIR